jgi:hypothetical protein
MLVCENVVEIEKYPINQLGLVSTAIGNTGASCLTPTLMICGITGD